METTKKETTSNQWYDLMNELENKMSEYPVEEWSNNDVVFEEWCYLLDFKRWAFHNWRLNISHLNNDLTNIFLS